MVNTHGKAPRGVSSPRTRSDNRQRDDYNIKNSKGSSKEVVVKSGKTYSQSVVDIPSTIHLIESTLVAFRH